MIAVHHRNLFIENDNRKVTREHSCRQIEQKPALPANRWCTELSAFKSRFTEIRDNGMGFFVNWSTEPSASHGGMICRSTEDIMRSLVINLFIIT